MKKQTAHEWHESFVDAAGLERIHQAVVKAESRTSAEIVPMIVRSSSLTGHVVWMLFLLLLLVFWAITPLVLTMLPADDLWTGGSEALALVLAAGGALVGSRFDFFNRHLTTARDQELNVHHRALLEFHLSRINETQAHTGVLIFVSMLERKAVVVADEKVSAVYGESTWKEALSRLLGKTREGDFATGMCDAIDKLGDQLSERFPLGANRPAHELSDRLIVKA